VAPPRGSSPCVFVQVRWRPYPLSLTSSLTGGDDLRITSPQRPAGCCGPGPRRAAVDARRCSPAWLLDWLLVRSSPVIASSQFARRFIWVAAGAVLRVPCAAEEPPGGSISMASGVVCDCFRSRPDLGRRRERRDERAHPRAGRVLAPIRVDAVPRGAVRSPWRPQMNQADRIGCTPRPVLPRRRRQVGELITLLRPTWTARPRHVVSAWSSPSTAVSPRVADHCQEYSCLCPNAVTVPP
jgi:hypothetical protein